MLIFKINFIIQKELAIIIDTALNCSFRGQPHDRM